jgi:hypothetical protein
MYLTQSQVDTILQTSYFTQPVTQSAVNYVLYRGHLNVTVHTLRFNCIDSFNENMVLQHLHTYLMSVYSLNTHIIASINYDLLLKNPNSNPSSFYLWRANSNAVHQYHRNSLMTEIFFPLTYGNLYQFARRALTVDIASLNVKFRESNVTVVRPIAFVFSFANI